MRSPLFALLTGLVILLAFVLISRTSSRKPTGISYEREQAGQAGPDQRQSGGGR